MEKDYSDYINRAESSECCGANVLGEDICAECGEHCEKVKNDELDD